MKYTRANVTKRRGKWQAVLTYYDEDGNRRFLTRVIPEAATKYDAEQRALQLMAEENAKAEAEAGQPGSADTGRTVGEHMTEYLEDIKASKSLEQSTIVGYGTSLGYIRTNLGTVPLVALTPSRVQQFVNALNKQGFSPSTVRKAYMLLHAGMDQAVLQGYIKRNPCDRKAVRLPKKGYTRPNALDEQGRAKVIKMLDAMERTPGTVAALIALYTGMRAGEVAGLRWRAVDLDAGTIHVCEAIAKKEGGTYSKDPKTNQDRYIPIAKGLATILKGWRAARFAEWSPGGQDEGKNSELFNRLYVIGSLDGSPRNPHSVGKDWTTIAQVYGITGTQGRRVTFHDLRHTFATATISKGADIRSVSDILGHENVAMTLNVYADADPNAKRRTVDMLDEELEAARASNVIPFRPTGTEG